MLTLTPENLEAMYNYLRLTKPFVDWNLPEGEDVKFTVIKSKKIFGEYEFVNKKQHHIRVSQNGIGHTESLAEVMAHEMIHLHLEESGMEMRGPDVGHNGAFRVYAASVCKVHGFDLRTFY